MQVAHVDSGELLSAIKDIYSLIPKDSPAIFKFNNNALVILAHHNSHAVKVNVKCEYNGKMSFATFPYMISQSFNNNDGILEFKFGKVINIKSQNVSIKISPISPSSITIPNPGDPIAEIDGSVLPLDIIKFLAKFPSPTKLNPNLDTMNFTDQYVWASSLYYMAFYDTGEKMHNFAIDLKSIKYLTIDKIDKIKVFNNFIGVYRKYSSIIPQRNNKNDKIFNALMKTLYGKFDLNDKNNSFYLEDDRLWRAIKRASAISKFNSSGVQIKVSNDLIIVSSESGAASSQEKIYVKNNIEGEYDIYLNWSTANLLAESIKESPARIYLHNVGLMLCKHDNNVISIWSTKKDKEE